MYSPLSDLPIISNVMWGDSTASRNYPIKRENEFDVQPSTLLNPPVIMQSTVQESSTPGFLTPPVSPFEPEPPVGFKMPSKTDLVFSADGTLINIRNCNNVEETIKYLYVLYNKTVEENLRRNSPAINSVANSNTLPTSPFHDIFQLAQEGLKPSQPTPNVLGLAAPNMPWMLPQQNFYQNSQIGNNAPIKRFNANLQKDTQENGRTRVNNPLKTVFSYDYFVFLALLNAPTGRMTVTEMYPFVQKYFYNFGNSDSWKSSIRHALNAKHRYFLKDGVCGKSAVYKIDPAKLEQLHIGIRRIVDKNLTNPEALRLRNINDLAHLLNGTAEFTSETHLVMRNQKPNVPTRGASTQVHNVAFPYMRPQAPVQQYMVQTNFVHQNQPMNQYLPEFYNQQFNCSFNQPMLPHQFNMTPTPGPSTMFQSPLQNQFQEETVQFVTENNEFADNMVQFGEAGPVGDVIDENGVNEEYIDIGEGQFDTEVEYFEIGENEQYEFVDDVEYTNLETNNFQ